MHLQLKNPTDANRKTIVKYTYIYFAITIALIGLTGIVGTGYIFYFVDIKYHDSIEVLWWIAGGTGVYGMTLAINQYLVILGRTRSLPLMTGLAAILNIALSIYLIKTNGMVGAAQATLFSYIFYFLFLFWKVKKEHPMPWLSFLKNEK